MDGGNQTGEAWPGPGARAGGRLPRLEDLSTAPDGYDPHSVAEAFDSFYRHIGRLDATLRALEAVHVFRDQASELRRELRGLKAASWAQRSASAQPLAPVQRRLPEWTPRLAIEAAFLIVVAVVAVAAGFDRLAIVSAMAFAWMIVGAVEWAASRGAFAPKIVLGRDFAPTERRSTPLRIVLSTTIGRVRELRARTETTTDLRTAAPGADAHVPSEPSERDGLDDSASAAPRAASSEGAPAHPPEKERPRRSRHALVVLVGLSAAGVTAGLIGASPFTESRDGRFLASEAPVRPHTPRLRPHAVSPQAIGGGPERASPRLEANAVIRAARGDSWVEVRANSADGKELYAGMLAHGRFVRARSKRIWLRLGAASNVDVRVNGKPVGNLFGTVAVLLAPGGVAPNAAA